jgi:hypothetical protein
MLVGLTNVGRATVLRLDMNDASRSTPFIQIIQMSRRIWQQMGLHPPLSDPRFVD